MPTLSPLKPSVTVIQSQMAFVDNLSITDFKGRVREEARRLNLAGLGTGLGFEENSDTVQANITRNNGLPRFFPPKRPNITCGHCSYNGHSEQECHKRIAEEYIAKQVQCQANQQANQKGQGHGRGHGRGRGRSHGGHKHRQTSLMFIQTMTTAQPLRGP